MFATEPKVDADLFPFHEADVPYPSVQERTVGLLRDKLPRKAAWIAFIASIPILFATMLIPYSDERRGPATIPRRTSPCSTSTSSIARLSTPLGRGTGSAWRLPFSLGWS